jgi:hypothetical protein
LARLSSIISFQQYNGCSGEPGGGYRQKRQPYSNQQHFPDRMSIAKTVCLLHTVFSVVLHDCFCKKVIETL